MEGLTRGDLIAAVFPGDPGKPRPALVLQDDAFSALTTVTVAPLTSEVTENDLFRISVEPTAENGLRKTSEAMIDKIMTISQAKIGTRMGRLEPDQLARIDRALSRFLGLAWK